MDLQLYYDIKKYLDPEATLVCDCVCNKISNQYILRILTLTSEMNLLEKLLYKLNLRSVGYKK